MEVKRNVCEVEIEDDVKWVKHYSSMHQILLVGEGDFSFSLSLANAFGSAINIVATSHDTYDNLLKKYGKAQSNVEELKKIGAAIMHEVDATKMKFQVGLRTRKFDRIVFNFPHAGFKGKEDHPQLIKLHRQLVRGFFKNASRMLQPYGEVHVSHKTAVPFSHWNLEELAAENSLVLFQCTDFCIEDYPGYSNRRGDGSRSDQPFPLGKCSTFKFIVGNPPKRKNPLRNTDLLLPSPSISPVMVNNPTSYGNISDISDLLLLSPSITPVMVNNQISYGNITDISYPQTPFPVNFDEMIPRSINGLAFRESTLPPLCRMNDFRLRIHELQFSTFPRIPLPSWVRSYTEVSEALRRASLGYYNYSRYYDEVNSRRVLETEGVWDEETHRRWLYLCHGMRA